MDSEGRHQLELLPARVTPYIEPVSPELIRSIRRRTTLLSAWNYAQDFACLEDKQCYGPLSIDGSHWSKIRKGLASPPAEERFSHYVDGCENEIVLIWLAESRCYDWTTIRKHQDDKDREIATLKQEKADLERSLQLVLEARQRTRP